MDEWMDAAPNSAQKGSVLPAVGRQCYFWSFQTEMTSMFIGVQSGKKSLVVN